MKLPPVELRNNEELCFTQIGKNLIRVYSRHLPKGKMGTWTLAEFTRKLVDGDPVAAAKLIRADLDAAEEAIRAGQTRGLKKKKKAA